MIVGVAAILFALLVYAPFVWVKYVMWRHSSEIEEMPGTGGELAQHLVDRFELAQVTVEKGKEGQDHYSPAEKLISLSPSVYDGKSITAVAVAAHEVGHAIQFSRQEPVSQLRGRYLSKAFQIKRVGTGFLMAVPLIIAIFKSPAVMLLCAIIGIITMIASALMYLAILPEEYDASFNKALPILSEGYIAEQHLPAASTVLKAAAYTYFAGALADTVRLWRWLRVFR